MENEEDYHESFEDEEIGIYQIKFATSIRNFKSQHSGPSIGSIEFTCTSMMDFTEKLFARVKTHLKRKVEFSVSDECGPMIPAWSEIEQPELSQLNEFVGFCNKTNKRVLLLDNLTTNHFVCWLEDRHPICLQIYVYGNAVANQSLFSIVQKALILSENRDRQYANSVKELLEMTQRLKRIHSESYLSADINFMLWAAFILEKEPHERSGWLNRGPPSELIHLFTRARSNADQQLLDIRQNLNVGREINDDTVATIKGLFEKYELLKQLHEKSGELIADFGATLASLVDRSTARVGLINAFETAVAPVEHPFGRQTLQNMENAPDVDHNHESDDEILYEPEYLDYEQLESEPRYM